MSERANCGLRGARGDDALVFTSSAGTPLIPRMARVLEPAPERARVHAQHYVHLLRAGPRLSRRGHGGNTGATQPTENGRDASPAQATETVDFPGEARAAEAAAAFA
jgi:hypothetical protein